MTASVVFDIPTMIRPIESRDISFVWETTLKVRKPYEVPWTTWRDDNGPRVLRDLNAEGSRVSVLESDAVLIGFAWWIGAVLTMLYVKRDLRGFGYGLALLGELRGCIHVHRPNGCWRKWTQRRNIRWREA